MEPIMPLSAEATANRAEYNRQYRLRNKDKANAYSKKHYNDNRDERLLQQTARRASLEGGAKEQHLAKQRAAKRKRTYGVTQEQFEQMLAEQNFSCAICLTDTPGGQGTWKVDHCHTSGAVRGLLCNGCNVGLGYFKDNKSALIAAAAYLEKHD